MPLLKDLIHIPERVLQGDFVLQLTRGVSQPAQTLRDYVVTPQLVESFDNALGFIQQAVQTSGSKAAYLHGSFGSGKSHFMAVLNLLLAGNTQARSIPELADVVARHSWTEGRKFLLVPYHMIGARDMESAILGQYAEFVAKRHPQAPVPGFYLAEGLFKDAVEMRARLGDIAFFAELGAGASGTEGGNDGWGDLDGGWDATRFEAALLEPPNSEERARLVGDLITRYFSAFRSLAGTGESYVSLDDGLSIMSRHAQALGYDAVILFLDELVLWLASHAADVNFVSREGTKLVKLVEATNDDRPVPLVSFVARQRDLRDLVGENLAGAVQVQFSDVLRHWNARFHRITLEDRNLPTIAEKRVLRPIDDAARQTLQDAFDESVRMRKEVLDTLLTTTADRDMFRKVYPFSPALVQTLIAVSAALQRERTALKLMLQLLVDRRDELELGQLIPVGDLYDAIADGEEPFSEGMRLHFDNAKRLYTQRLLPMLERQHNVTWEAIKLGQADAVAARNLRNDARLLKTLLLGALVPEVETLKGLTAPRLAALNHGSVRSPIPGREGQDVLRKCRDWASEIGEIKIAEGHAAGAGDPLISIQITGVDIEPILRAAETHDNVGNRRRKIREVLFTQLDIDGATLFANYDFLWRNTPREVEVVYENVREMSDDKLRGQPGAWSIVLDFPFDDANFGPSDDLARLQQYRGGESKTLVWLPALLSKKASSELGRLVVLDHVLQGERFDTYAAHLSYVDRVQARSLASNQRDQLQIKLRAQLEVAYGISTEPADAVRDPLTADQQFQSLDPTFTPRPPVGADFHDAFDNLLDQLFSHQYPDHPSFETEIKPAIVRKVWPEIQNALQANDHRGPVDTAMRKTVRGIVNPARIGHMAETHLRIDPYWHELFSKRHAGDGGGAITVAKLRLWLNTPQPTGLPTEIQNLIIMTYAAATNRRFTLRGGPVEPTVDKLADELELREQVLPDPDDWQRALHRASSLFGLTLAQTLNAANVGYLIDEVRRAAAGKREFVSTLIASLRDRARDRDRDRAQTADGPSERERTAASAQALLASVAQAADGDLVATLARADLATSEAAVSRTLGQAQVCAGALAATSWLLFDAIAKLQDHRLAPAQKIIARLQEVLGADEHVIALKPQLDALQRQAVDLLAAATPEVQPEAPPVLPDTTSTSATAPTDVPEAPGLEVVEENQASNLSGAIAQQTLERLKTQLAGDDDLALTISWRLERKGTRP